MSRATFVTDAGIPVFLEEDHALPLVDVEVVIARGSTTDPVGQEGLTRLTARMMRRGPKGRRSEAFDEHLDRLGSSLGASVLTESTRFHATVLKRNIAPFLKSLGGVITAPALRKSDFARVRRRAVADVRSLQDHDRALAARALRGALFGAHAYSRPVWGTETSLGRIGLSDVRAHHDRLVRSRHVLLGFAGAVTEDELRPWVEAAFAGIPRDAVSRPRSRSARRRAGRRVVVVDKPQRTQTQLFVGSLGMRAGDERQTPAAVANTGFGVMFTSRLVREVRSKRGWSYGANSHLAVDRQRESWTMWTHPGAEQLLDCLALQLRLVEQWCDKGLSAKEIRSAKRYLIKSHAFDRETAHKRLSAQLEAALYALPHDWHSGFAKRLSRVTRPSAHAAIRSFLDPSELTIALVATHTPELERGLRALSGVRDVRVLPYVSL